MSTSEAQVMARALYDSIISATLQSLRSATARLADVTPQNAELRVSQVLAADTPPQVRNFLLALVSEGRLSDLASVVRNFERYAEGISQGAVSGEVTSAVELDEPQRTSIAQQLRATYGERLDLRFRVDPSIIGGLIIRVGDQVLDNSVRTRLSAVQRSMLSS